jgi:coproporphyrinogen III oxidase-like Fe-S oxidoreductase
VYAPLKKRDDGTFHQPYCPRFSHYLSFYWIEKSKDRTTALLAFAAAEP